MLITQASILLFSQATQSAALAGGPNSESAKTMDFCSSAHSALRELVTQREVAIEQIARREAVAAQWSPTPELRTERAAVAELEGRISARSGQLALALPRLASLLGIDALSTTVALAAMPAVPVGKPATVVRNPAFAPGTTGQLKASLPRRVSGFT